MVPQRNAIRFARCLLHTIGVIIVVINIAIPRERKVIHVIFTVQTNGGGGGGVRKRERLTRVGRCLRCTGSACNILLQYTVITILHYNVLVAILLHRGTSAPTTMLCLSRVCPLTTLICIRDSFRATAADVPTWEFNNRVIINILTY